ncbi:MAG: potassium transporter TrkG [Candidatus Krumholzibacteriota bacterium]|nr:potassium transporter TrkG [Candidatus Krumholzibacteriota bacterium]
MNVKYVIKILAVLLLILAVFMILPVILAFYYREAYLSISFLVPVSFILIFSSIVLWFTRKEETPHLSTRDGFLLVSSGWFSAAALGAIPFVISGAIPSITDAFFEAMSGFTTTGASILTDIESLPKTILFWRSLTHWLGGMGIIVLLVAIFQFIGAGGLGLLKAEAPGPTVDKITPKITKMAKILWFVYVGLTLCQIILLMAGGMDLFNASTHAFGTMATGGFSTKAGSVGHYSSPFIHYVITIFMLLAGINFVLYFKMLTGKIDALFKDTELKVYLSIFAVASIIIAVSLYGNSFPSVEESFRYAVFQAASILTTTGFATDDFASWPFMAQAVLFILMFVGGCSGSTGGGIKVIRYVKLFKLGNNQMKYLLHPRGIFKIKVGENILKKDVMYLVSGFFFLYILLLFVVSLIVSSGGNSILTSFSSALVTLGNIGPGFGRVGPTLNFSFYPDYIKWVLSFAMMAGRLEIYTLLVIFTPMFWKK